MTLELHFHPLASFCQKVLIALYENGTGFEPRLVDLGDERSRAAFLELSPIGKMPVLRDPERQRTVPESSIIIEYLDLHHPGRRRLIPAEPERALAVRQWDRFFDLYVSEPMQKIVTDRLRPPGRNDPHGVAAARGLLSTAYAVIERDLAGRAWAAGEDFSMADCAAAPALFYADRVQPFGPAHPGVAAYFARLLARPSVARVFEEARPFLRLFPEEPATP